MKSIVRHILFLLVIFLPGLLFAQTEADVLKSGNKKFDDGNYVEAKRDFEILISLNQTNATYNYKYGTCLLFSDGNKSQGLKYLKYASQNSSVEKECWFYLGKAYHINYQFNEAIKAYQKFASLASTKEKEKFQVDRQIEMCNNGKKLLKNISEAIVLDKRDKEESEFFRLYSMENIGGQLIVVDELRSDLDKKNKHRIVLHNPKNSDVIFYSTYGTDGKNGKEIYKVNRLPNGGWAQAQPVKGAVNTPYDEEFPFMHANGTTLYFCSKGHNSMGGYDIFKSEYNSNTDAFGPVENVDFAISSPDDDMLYIVDSLDRTAWFASARESQDGKIYVYNVRVERIPVLISIIKGKFVNEIEKTSLSATIRIEDMTNNELVGVYNTKSADGGYLITLEKSGKYKFTVIPASSNKVHVAEVEIPYQKEIRPLKQEISIVEELGTEKLVIKNLFSENVEDAELIIAEVMRERAKLNITGNIDIDSLDRIRDSLNRDHSADFIDNLSNEDLLKMVKEDAAQLDKEATELKEKMEAAYVVADNKNKEAKEKALQAEKLIASLSDNTNPQERDQIIADAEELNKQSIQLLNEAAAGIELAKYFNEQYTRKKEEANTSANYAKGIEDALASNNHKEAISKLKLQQEYIKSVMAPELNKSDLLTEAKVKYQQKQEEANKALDYAQDLRKEEEDINRKIKNLQSEYEITKNKNRKKEIEKELEQLTDDRSTVQSDLRKAFERQKLIQNEADVLAAQVRVMEEIASGNISTTLSETRKEQLGNEITNGDATKAIEKNNQFLAENADTRRDDRVDMNEYFNENPNYKDLNTKENEIAAITDEKTRLEEKNKLNEQWVNNIDNDVKELNTQLTAETNPEKKKEIESKIIGLEKVKEDKQNETKKNNEKMTTIASQPADRKKEEDVIKEVYSAYTEEKTLVDNSNESEEIKANKRIELNNELVNNVNKDLIRINNELKSNPTNKTELEERKNTLEKIKTDKRNEIEKDKKIVISSSAPELTSTQKTVLENTDPGYQANIEAIDLNTSNENEKAIKRNEANTELVSRIDSKIESLQEERKNSTDKSSVDKQIEELKELKEIKNNEIRKDKKTLADNKIIRTDSKGDPLYSYTEKTDYKNPEAEKIAANNETKIDQIEASEKTITGLKIKESVSTDEKEKKDLAKQITKEEEKLQNLELAVAQNVEKANAAEKKEWETKINEKKEKVRNNPEATGSVMFDKAQELEQKAKDQFILAANLRIQANNERDKKKKNELLKTAAEAEIKGNEFLAEADRIYDVLLDEFVMITKVEDPINPVIVKTTLTEIDPSYENSMTSVNNNDKPENEKAKERIRINEELITRIEREEAVVAEQIKNNNGNPEELKQKQDALAQIKEEKRNEIRNDEVKANETAIVSTNTDPVISVLNNDQKTEIATMDNSFIEKRSNIDNSDKSDVRKANEKNELNESLLTQIDKKIITLETDITSPNVKDKEEKEKQLEELKETKAVIENDITKNDKTLEQGGVVKENRNTDSYTENPVYTNETAIKEATAVTQKTETIRTSERNLEDLKIKRSETTDENEKKNLDKLIKKEESNLLTQELAVAAAYQKANEAEKKSNETKLATKKEEADIKNIPSDDALNIRAHQLERKAEEEFTNAANLRLMATKEKDKEKKNDLLKEANEAELRGIEYQKEADRTYNMMLEEFSLTASSRKLETVPENIEERESTRQLEEATRYNNQAEELNLRATNLEAQIPAAKKKDKIKIQQEADALRLEALKYEKKANNAEEQAAITKKLEEDFLAEQARVADEEKRRKELGEIVRRWTEYAKYYDLEIVAVASRKKVVDAENEGKRLSDLAENLRKEANGIRIQADNETDEQVKTELQAKATQIETSANGVQRKSDSLKIVASRSGIEYDNAAFSSRNYLQSIEKQKADDIRFVVNNGKNLIEPIREVISDSALAVGDFKAPEIITDNLFTKTDKPIYSDANPIPVNPKMPAGAYFKVQVGAFRNKIPQDLYKEFAPVSGETTPNGLTRYTVGFFTDLGSADRAKTDVRGLGYRDAFVVAFCNGERIPIAKVKDCVANANGIAITPVNPINPINPVNPVNPVNPTITNYYDTVAGAAKANQVEVIKGLFYTVQIGVYSRPVSPDKLFNIVPLNSELTRNRLVRYTTGIYTDINPANARKEQIRTIGIKDAFVTAYMNGKKLTVEQAADSVRKYGNSIFADPNNLGASNLTPVNPVINPAGKYKVILGQYKNDVPVRDAEIYLSNNSRGIKKAVTSDGTSIYYLEGFTTEAEAESVKNEFISKGLTGVYVSDKLPSGETNTPNVNDPEIKVSKDVTGLVFQVYLGEYLGEVPREDAEVFLANSSKGLKQKVNPEGYKIYYVCECAKYDDAMAMKAHFIAEGLSSVRIVSIKDGNEISLSDAIKLIYE